MEIDQYLCFTLINVVRTLKCISNVLSFTKLIMQLYQNQIITRIFTQNKNKNKTKDYPPYCFWYSFLFLNISVCIIIFVFGLLASLKMECNNGLYCNNVFAFNLHCFLF